MTKTEADFWACKVCRSINTQRSNRCYSCHTPREVAGVKPTEISVTEARPVLGPIGTYRSTETQAVLVTIATIVFILGTYVALWIGWRIGDLRALRQRDAADQLLAESTLLIALPAVLGIVALLAYAWWISRSVANLPPLGAGFSRASPTWAFLEPLIPGLNLYALPARAGEIITKLGGSTIGTSLVAISFFLLIGPPIIAAIVMRISRTFEGREFFRTVAGTLIGMFTVQVIGLLIALYVVWHIEGMFRSRVADNAKQPTPAPTSPMRRL